MGLDFRLSQNLSQKQILSPQILQSVELLQLSTTELSQRIAEELDTNEFLEMKVKESVPESTAPADGAFGDGAAATGDDSHVDGWEASYTSDDRDFGTVPTATGRDAGQDKIEAMNNAPGDGPTLAETLLRQFDALEGAAKLRPLAEQILFNLDEKGWLRVPLEDACALLADRFDSADAERALRMIQSLEPKGIGARTMAECLILQLDPADSRFATKKKLLSEHYKDMLDRKDAVIERALGITSDERKAIYRELAHLNLRPGASVDPDGGRRMYVNPDLSTEWDGERYSVTLINDWVPQIRISRRAMEALQRGDADKDFERYARSKYEAAKALVEAVKKRKQTLLHVGRILVDHQKDFLDYGPAHLKPLRMQEVAEKVGVHTSTVSRAVSGKYIQTHRGMFPLKDFFAAGTTSVDGRSESRESVKLKVKDIIEREGAGVPLSDDHIVQRLLALHGIKVARRTVTKYRKALGIAASRHRRSD